MGSRYRRQRFVLLAIFLAGVSGTGSLCAQETTVKLSTSTNPAVFGQLLSLTAIVSTSAATGKVTFYDGAAVLGSSAVSVGKAVFSTALLQAGNRSLKAYYAGDGSHSTATSPIVAQRVSTNVSNGLTVSDVLQTSGSIAAGDFNGDGKADLAVAAYNGIMIFLGRGDGTFTTGAVIPGSYYNPTALAVGDFNRDGKPDLAVVSSVAVVAILIGNGDGTFQRPVNYFVGQNQYTSVAVGDFNGDGKPDLAITGDSDFTEHYNDEVSILLGNGDGTFQAAVAYKTDYGPNSIALGDFNGDGQTDLAVACAGINILLGNGDGTFQPARSYPAGQYSGSVAAGDFNADGKLDLAMGTSGGIYIFLGNGDGTFQPAITYATIGYPQGLAVGDFNGDGKLDLAVSVGTALSIFLGRGDGTFFSAPDQNNIYASSLAVADFDGNGLADIVAAGW